LLTGTKWSVDTGFLGDMVPPFFPGFEPPISGDGHLCPRTSNVLVGDPRHLVGDYTNPLLKPEAADILKKDGEISRCNRLGRRTARASRSDGPAQFLAQGVGARVRPACTTSWSPVAKRSRASVRLIAEGVKPASRSRHAALREQRV
jgi:hypothetical protein